MKILCICEHGNVRSVALAYLLKTIYGYDVLNCGLRENSEDTRKMLYEWADKIIALDKDIFIFVDRESEHLNKLYLLDVGKDIWFNPRDPELQHKLLKKLKSLNL